MNMQEQSNNIGEIIRINLNSIYDSYHTSQILKHLYVEPTSPIKTFAGNLLKKRNYIMNQLLINVCFRIKEGNEKYYRYRAVNHQYCNKI